MTLNVHGSTSLAEPGPGMVPDLVADAPVRRPAGKVAQLSPGLRLVAGSMRLLDRAAPRLATSIMLHHFTHPRRARRADSATVLSQDLQRIELRHRGNRLHAWQCGPSDRRVLLVHGWEDHSGSLRPLARRLLEQGLGVVALDAPGHGHSARADTDLLDTAGALASLLERHGPVHGVVAHSWGAAASLLMLERHPQWQPERIALVAPMRGIEQHLDIFAGIAGLCRPRLERLSRKVEARLDLPLDSLCAVKAAASLAGSALVVHDRMDPLIPYAVSRELVERWAGSDLMTTRELGHRRILRDPAVQDRIVAHLRGRA